MVMYVNEFETKENKNWTKDKIEPQHVCLTSHKQELWMPSCGDCL